MNGNGFISIAITAGGDEIFYITWQQFLDIICSWNQACLHLTANWLAIQEEQENGH